MPERSELALVVGVSDGDTIRCVRIREGSGGDVELFGGVFAVRLRGIDAPEVGQLAYTACSKAARVLLQDKRVVLHRGPMDRYGRLVCRVTAPGIGDVCHRFVREGIAVCYHAFGGDLPEYHEAEAKAKAERLLFWGLPPFVMPWDFRHLRRGYHERTEAMWRFRGRP